MKDQDIRAVLKAELMRKYAGDSNTLVLDELGIRHGLGRLDLAVVNHRLHGYEIKGDLDNLRRLPDQIKVFSSVADRMTLVVSYRHAGRAFKMVPDWWGVRLAEPNEASGSVVLNSARAPRNNPSVDINALVTLLWRNEALAMLEGIDAADGVRSKSRKIIYHRLVEAFDPEDLKTRIRQQLRNRKAWRVAEPQTSCGD
ncbi:sce7726 family protein [Dehalogenimonas sp. 4OHTPN]|uniref:Sce7726 family protein n=1 Tax=Dehalogenimonas sp. 4OHTPN TaxID=3166643 RepID=A0AAU8GAM8_9CHLR